MAGRLVKICGSDSKSDALAKGLGAAMKVLGRKKMAKAEATSSGTPQSKEGLSLSTSSTVSKSKIACPDCGKDQIEHDNGFVCRCSVRKVIAKA